MINKVVGLGGKFHFDKKGKCCRDKKIEQKYRRLKYIQNRKTLIPQEMWHKNFNELLRINDDYEFRCYKCWTVLNVSLEDEITHCDHVLLYVFLILALLCVSKCSEEPPSKMAREGDVSGAKIAEIMEAMDYYGVRKRSRKVWYAYDQS